MAKRKPNQEPPADQVEQTEVKPGDHFECTETASLAGGGFGTISKPTKSEEENKSES